MFGFLQNQREIADYLHCLKMQQSLLPVDIRVLQAPRPLPILLNYVLVL